MPDQSVYGRTTGSSLSFGAAPRASADVVGVASLVVVPCAAPLEAYGHGPVLGGYVYREGDEGPGYYTSAVAEPPPEAVD